jgi:hypothetical protein
VVAIITSLEVEVAMIKIAEVAMETTIDKVPLIKIKEKRDFSHLSLLR